MLKNMSFSKLTYDSEKFLSKLIKSSNPTQFLRKCYKEESKYDIVEINHIIEELIAEKYITVLWKDDLPWCVILNDSAKIYDKTKKSQLIRGKQEKEKIIINDNSIHIGDGNKIKKSTIIGSNSNHQINTREKNQRKFCELHPTLSNILIGVIVGFIMMLPFWGSIITWLQGVF